MGAQWDSILVIDFEKAYVSVRREELYNILTEFGMPMKLVRLIKTCLNETYSKVRISKNLSDAFPIQSGLKQGDFYSHCFRRCYQVSKKKSKDSN
jgi:hypothetical protein